MAFRSIRILRRTTTLIHNFNSVSTAVPLFIEAKWPNLKQYKTKDNIVYLEDPDTFGTLGAKPIVEEEIEDEGDIKEREFIENAPLTTQKLTIKQYSDIIKQYIKQKRLKEAIDVLEIRMLQDDRVKPENYIYNILIGACADVGYTQKAFKLFNDMKRRGLKPTGDTYTCLFNCCAHSPWSSDGLKRATHLRELMIEKGIEPNLTNYNAMIKAFGRKGDITTAFQIVDEMVSKKIKVRVHTYNHLIQACISDTQSGLRHALLVWRKMINSGEKPNIYSFNLMLKCVKDCMLGTEEDITELIVLIEQNTLPVYETERLQPEKRILNAHVNVGTKQLEITDKKSVTCIESAESSHSNFIKQDDCGVLDTEHHELIQVVDRLKFNTKERKVPNLLSRKLIMDNVCDLKEVYREHDRFAVIGGQDDFINEMDSYSVKPDIKTFTQMLFLIEQSREVENKLIETMKESKVYPDIDFYNMLIKKRSMRCDYEGAFLVKDMIKADNKFHMKHHYFKKNLILKLNIMTYGVLALACDTKEKGAQLLKEMADNQLKVNSEIAETLLRHGTIHGNFEYIYYILDVVTKEKLRVNYLFMSYLERFDTRCKLMVEKKNKDSHFLKEYRKFTVIYTKWLKTTDLEEALKPEHPWTQFKHSYPEALQREKRFEVKVPKKFYKRKRNFVKFAPNLNY